MQEYPQYREAKVLFEQKKFEEAQKLYAAAAKSHSQDPNVWHDWGVCFLHLNQPLLALEKIEMSVQLQPDYSYRYSSRAYVKTALKDVHGAVADYKKAIELDPEDAIAYNNLGLLEEQLGYMKEAKEKFEIADELNKILDDQKIAKEAATPPPTAPDQPATTQEKQPIIETEKPDQSVWKEMSKVFSKSDSFKEYIHFLKNGFKLKK